MSHKNVTIPLVPFQKEKIITGFFDYLDRDDEKVLNSAENLAEIIDALDAIHISNGLRDKLVKKALEFISEIENPRICWEHLARIEFRAEPAFMDLKKNLNERADVLVSAISAKNCPNWFWELLQYPADIPKLYREVFRKKASDIECALDHNTDVCEKRTYEKGG